MTRRWWLWLIGATAAAAPKPAKVLMVYEDTLSAIAMIYVPADFTDRDMDAVQKLNTWGHSFQLQRAAPVVTRLDKPKEINAWIDALIKEIG